MAARGAQLSAAGSGADTVHYFEPTGKAAALCVLQWIVADGVAGAQPQHAVKGCWQPESEFETKS